MAEAEMEDAEPDIELPRSFEVWSMEVSPPTTLPSCSFPRSLGEVQKGRLLGGGLGAWQVKHGGKIYVAKKGQSAGHVLAEYCAAKIYRAVGFNAPDCCVYTEGGRSVEDDAPAGAAVLLTQYIEGTLLGRCSGEDKKRAHADIRRAFVVDVLLGNWDVIGLEEDNVIVSSDLKAWRIDSGGTFEYRGGGTKKTRDQWTPEVAELWTMRDVTQAQQAAHVFVPISELELGEQIFDLVCRHRSGVLGCLHNPVRRSMVDARMLFLATRWVTTAANLPLAAFRLSNTFDTIADDPARRVPGACWIMCMLLASRVCRQLSAEDRRVLVNTLRSLKTRAELLPEASRGKNYLVDRLLDEVTAGANFDPDVPGFNASTPGELLVDACADGDCGRTRLFVSATTVNYVQGPPYYQHPLYAAITSSRPCSDEERELAVDALLKCHPLPDFNLRKRRPEGDRTALAAAAADGRGTELQKYLKRAGVGTSTSA